MRRAGKVRWGELKVGILVALAVIAMLYASFRGGGTSIFEKKNDYICYFSDLEGLAAGSPVWLAGVEVGNVRSVDFLREQRELGKGIEVRLTMKKSVSYLITPGTVAQLGTMGLIGDKYIRLIPGPPSDTFLVHGSVIPTIGATGLEGALEELPETIKRINTLLASAECVMASLDSAGGTLPMLIRDRELARKIANLVDKSDNLVAALDKSTSSMTEDMSAVADDFHALSEELLTGKGTLARLLKDPEPFEYIISATAHLDTLLRKVESGEGTAGQLANDQELYNDMKDLTARMNTLIKDLMDNPKKYFKFSVF